METTPILIAPNIEDRGLAYSDPPRVYVNPGSHETLLDMALTAVHELVHLATGMEASESYCDLVAERLLTRSRALQQAVFLALARAMFSYLGGGGGGNA